MVNEKSRGQAAMEYLMTYGWALLVIVVVIAILLAINPFSAPQGCRFDQIGFLCNNPVVDEAGNLYLSITNANNNAIIIYAVVCTADKSPNPPIITVPASGVSVQRQGTYKINKVDNPTTCVKDGSTMVSPAGTDFSGKIWVFYKNEEEGAYPYRTISATMSTKVVKDIGVGTGPATCGATTCSGATPVCCTATNTCAANLAACAPATPTCGGSPYPAGTDKCCADALAYNDTLKQCCIGTGDDAGKSWLCTDAAPSCGAFATQCT